MVSTTLLNLRLGPAQKEMIRNLHFFGLFFIFIFEG